VQVTAGALGDLAQAVERVAGKLGLAIGVGDLVESADHGADADRQRHAAVNESALGALEAVLDRIGSLGRDSSDQVDLAVTDHGRLAERGQLSDTIAGLAKLNNTRKARQVCAEARDMLGGNGILLENHVIRHMADIEAIHTHEVTETMQTLIVGRDITGVGAFS
jgi:alkylation response protein AidB-like acyl-CoA dehydrogenase